MIQRSFAILLGLLCFLSLVCRLAIYELECVVHPLYPFRLLVLLLAFPRTHHRHLFPAIAVFLAVACSPAMYYKSEVPIYDGRLHCFHFPPKKHLHLHRIQHKSRHGEELYVSIVWLAR